MALAAVAPAWLAPDQLSFNQSINDVDRGMMFDLKAFAQLQNSQAFSGESFDGQQGLVLFWIETCFFPKQILAEAEEFSAKISELGQSFVIVGL